MVNFAKQFNVDTQDQVNDKIMGLKRRDGLATKFILSNSEEFKREYFPLKTELNSRNHIVGVRQYGSWARFQFIMINNSVSRFADSKCNNQEKWKDHRIPVGSTISLVKMMVLRSDKQLYGLKFF